MSNELLSYRQKLQKGLVTFKPGSRKAQIFVTFQSKGEDAAKAQAKKLSIKESSIRSWLGDWKFLQRVKGPSPLKGEVKPSPKREVKKAPARKSTKSKKAA